MKKIFRMALVFALAGAALLYTSCTKDYSPDILEVQKQVNALDGQMHDALVTLGEVQEKIKGLASTEDVNKAIDALKDEIAKGYATKEYVDTEIGKIYDELGNIYDELLLIEGDVEDLQDLVEAIDLLDDYISTYVKFIQSIAYVPATSDGTIPAIKYVFSDGEKSEPLLVASFKVTPTEALSRVTETSASLVAVETKSAAAAPDTLAITKMVFRDDAPGYVDVYAVNDLDCKNFAIALSVTQVENTLTESVTSDYAPVALKDEASDLVFAFSDAETDDVAVAGKTIYDTEVKVSPSSPSDSVKVFTAGRWIVKGEIESGFFTPEELAEIFDVELPLVSPAEGDTAFSFAPAEYYSNNSADEALDASVWPTRPGTIVDILNNANAPKTYELAAYLNNGHVSGPCSGNVVATYVAVPDTVAFDLTPAEAVAIPWDYKYWDDINDTTIKNVAVPEDIDAALLKDAEKTLSINKESKVDYTDGKGDVVANEDNTVDAEIVSTYAYGAADSTFTYTAEKYNAKNATVYAGSFDYVVKARPADLVLEYELADTCVRFEKRTWFKNLPFVADIVENQPEYLLDGKYEEDDVIDDIAATLKPQFDSLVVYLDGEKIAWDGYGFSIAADGCQFGFKLDKLGAYEFHLFDHAFGIKYEFVLKVNVVNNAAKIAPKATYVTVDNEETKDYSVEVKGDYGGLRSGYHYYLEDQPLQDYLKVVDYAEDSDVLVLGSALATPYAVGKVDVPASNNPTALVRLTENKTVANLATEQTYSWGAYDSLQFKVAATLIPSAKRSAVIDSATVRLWTKDPIPVFEAGELTALHEKDQYATADLFSALTVQDLNGYDLVGESTILGRYIVLPVNGRTVFGYDQKLTVGKPVIVSGVDYIEEVRLEIVNNSVLRLKLNQGTITTPIVVKVPVTLTYMLDKGLDDKNTVDVYVTFKEKEAPVTE